MAEENVSQEWQLSFHGVNYLINLEARGQSLVLDAEQIDNNERWSGEFTSQYIEEITQKAGNHKKFNVFCKMLCSGFAKESESVFVDLLTYADLEMLKARKTGQSTSGSISSSKAQHKRYIILTYQNEFDRVHYPLPLAFEETPNAEALKRTIRRLRSQADTKNSSMTGDFNGRTLTQLRQENTELRHRLRQSESRASKTTLKSPLSPGSQQSPAASELALAYSKLKKQYDTTRKELSDLSIAHDRLKNDSAREISKWKAKFVSAYESAGTAGAAGNVAGGDSRELRRRVAVLERDLETERLEHRKSVALHKKEMSELLRRQKSAPVTGRSTSAGSVGSGSRASSSERARDREILRERQRSSRKTGTNLSDRTKTLSRSVSPAEPSGRGRNARSVSPASSTGKKFDPTDWVNQQNEKKSRSLRQAWGGGSRYYRESGYSSANSDQSSRAGSRNSARSVSAGSASSNGSRGSRISEPRSADPLSGRSGQDPVKRRKKKLDSDAVKAKDDFPQVSKLRIQQTMHTRKEPSSDHDFGNRENKPFTNELVVKSQGMPLSARMKSPRNGDFNLLASDDGSDVLTWSKASIKGSDHVPSTRSREVASSPLLCNSQSSQSLVANLAQQKLLRESLTSENSRTQISHPSIDRNQHIKFPSSQLSDLSVVDDFLTRGDGPSLRSSLESNAKSSDLEASIDLSRTKSPGRVKQQNGNSPHRHAVLLGTEEYSTEDNSSDLNEIDKRIMALQSFLQNARSGIFNDHE